LSAVTANQAKSPSNISTQNQQQLDDSSHGPVSKNLLVKLAPDVCGLRSPPFASRSRQYHC